MCQKSQFLQNSLFFLEVDLRATEFLIVTSLQAEPFNKKMGDVIK